MVLIFEDQFYPEGTLQEFLPCDMLSWSADGQWVKTTYVGYCYVAEPVFILPKVFIDSKGRPFGKEHGFSAFLCGADIRELLGDEDSAIVSRLSFWLYQAIVRYSERNPGTVIVRNGSIQEIESVGEYSCFTLLDIIQSLRKFRRDHSALITMIVKSNRSGASNVCWSKTLDKVHPYLSNGAPVYVDFISKKKTINFDEEIIVLFYSVLEYLKELYFFEEPVGFNFSLLPSHAIQDMIDEGTGTVYLERIRHKYFSDELVALWKLLYVFFERFEAVECKGYAEEMVLATSFNNVFEDMVDQLIGSDGLAGVKKNKDGKIIDHLYQGASLLNNGSTYFIADSKYYKESSDLGENSVYKQFTYARNIIQYNLDQLQKGAGLSAMRDELTEGYSILPNFFIRASAVGEDGLYDYGEERLSAEFDIDRAVPGNRLVSSHFPNRLFDRDTLVLQTYNISFLYVLAKYVEGEDSAAKARIRRKFRDDLIRRFDSLYLFYELRPLEGKTVEDVVEANFRALLGRAIRLSPHGSTLIFAWEREPFTGGAPRPACEDYLGGLKHVSFTPTSLRALNSLPAAE